MDQEEIHGDFMNSWDSVPASATDLRLVRTRGEISREKRVHGKNERHAGPLPGAGPDVAPQSPPQETSDRYIVLVAKQC
jgi:hypothetical protein